VALHGEDGTFLRLIAVSRRIGAQTFALTTTKLPDGKKKNERGMTAQHPSLDAAKAAVEKLAVEAAKLGWSKAERRAGYTARPDAFDKLPAPPKAVAQPATAKAGRKK
jgi:hypothetical protein